MNRSANVGLFDQVLTFYAPTFSKNSIGEKVPTFSAQTPTLRGQRIFKTSAERFEAMQQVGETTQDFRVYDRVLSIDQTWEFDVYTINNSAPERYKISGIEREGLGNFLRITATKRDNI